MTTQHKTSLDRNMLLKDTHKRSFEKQGFLVVENLLCSSDISLVAESFCNSEHDRWPDLPGVLRTSVNDLPVLKGFHEDLADFIGYVVSSPSLKASYTFTARYESGSALPRHTDRPQCQYNVSLMLGAYPDSTQLSEWPLFIEVNGAVNEIRLASGDAVLYRGTENPHWRDVMPRSIDRVEGVFLHFVDASFQGSTR